MNPISILLVDDTKETLEVIALCLQSLGHDVTRAHGGNEAIALMEDDRFDLVMTDVLMPDTDGVQVIMAARRLQPEAQVIAMTGGGDFFGARELLKLAGKVGADAQLAKPFSRAQLALMLETVCGRRTEFAGAA